MVHLLQPISTLIIGIAMTVYGIAHSIVQFPGPVAFRSLVANLPAFGALLVFMLGFFAIITGVTLVVLGVRNVRRRWRRFGQIARHVEMQSPYGDEREACGPAYR